MKFLKRLKSKKHLFDGLIKRLKILLLVIISVLLIYSGYFLVSNLVNMFNYSVGNFGDANKKIYESKLDSNNIFIFVRDKSSGYELVTGFFVLQQNPSTRNFKLLNISTTAIVSESKYGSNMEVSKILQYMKLKGDSINDFISFWENYIALKSDGYIIIDREYIKDFHTYIGPLTVSNEYDSNVFKKGKIEVNNSNFDGFWNNEYSNEGQRLVNDNKYMVEMLKRFGNLDFLLSFSKLSLSTKEHIFTNIESSDFRNLISDLVSSANKISLSFTPTNIFNIVSGKRYMDQEKFDKYIRDNFSDKAILREQVRIEVLNASNEKGLATKVGRYLSNAGLSINRTGNFSVEVSKNTIYIKDSNKYEKTTEYLKKIFVDADFKYESPEKLSTADILILVKTFK
jgi:hypothetical protein